MNDVITACGPLSELTVPVYTMMTSFAYCLNYHKKCLVLNEFYENFVLIFIQNIKFIIVIIKIFINLLGNICLASTIFTTG